MKQTNKQTYRQTDKQTDKQKRHGMKNIEFNFRWPPGFFFVDCSAALFRSSMAPMNNKVLLLLELGWARPRLGLEGPGQKVNSHYLAWSPPGATEAKSSLSFWAGRCLSYLDFHMVVLKIVCHSKACKRTKQYRKAQHGNYWLLS